MGQLGGLVAPEGPKARPSFARARARSKHIRVVRKGSIELVSQGDVLDVLGEGELFGHPSMLSGLPAWFEARAGEDTLCYRLPAESVVPSSGAPPACDSSRDP